MTTSEAVPLAVRMDGNTLVIRGELDAHNAGIFHKGLSALLPTFQGLPILLDLSDLQFVDLIGIRPLLRWAERWRELGTPVILMWWNATLFRLLTMLATVENLASIRPT